MVVTTVAGAFALVVLFTVAGVFAVVRSAALHWMFGAGGCVAATDCSGVDGIEVVSAATLLVLTGSTRKSMSESICNESEKKAISDQ